MADRPDAVGHIQQGFGPDPLAPAQTSGCRSVSGQPITPETGRGQAQADRGRQAAGKWSARKYISMAARYREQNQPHRAAA
jgi:hypothetical protein